MSAQMHVRGDVKDQREGGGEAGNAGRAPGHSATCCRGRRGHSRGSLVEKELIEHKKQKEELDLEKNQDGHGC